MKIHPLVLTAIFSGLAAAAPSKPNIVLIYADDLGYGDLSCNGATAVQTPNADRLAKEGINFSSGYCSSATCTPSRYSMLTGEYTFRQKGTGILPSDAKLIIEPGRATLASALKSAGYKTGVVGRGLRGKGDLGALGKIEMLKTDTLKGRMLRGTPESGGIGRQRFSLFKSVALRTALPRLFLAAVFWDLENRSFAWWGLER